MNKELNIGDYVRQKRGHIYRIKNKGALEAQQYRNEANDKENEDFIAIKSSPDINDLIEYMDLLWVKHPVKLYDSETTIGLFNPVRCDGFTEFEDGTHCIILNLDYLVNVKELRISGIITHEQIEQLKYKIGE